MEGLLRGIRAAMASGGRLATVPVALKLEQSLFYETVRRHPRYAALQDNVLGGWLTAFGDAWAADIEKMRTAELACLGAHFWPNAAHDQRATTLLKLMQWYFTVDDAFGDLHSGAQAHRLCEQLTHHIFFEPSASIRHAGTGIISVHRKQPLITAIGSDWWHEMERTTVSPVQKARFRSEFCKYLQEQAQEVTCRERLVESGRLPGVEDYVQMRRVSSGFATCISMVEYDLGMELEQEKLGDPQMKEMQDAIVDLACWINDIHSFPKELANGDLLNLLPVLHVRNMRQQQEGGSAEKQVAFEEAVCEAWRMFRAREEQCAALASELIERHGCCSPSFRQYVETACAIGTGVWAWTLQSARYKLPKSKCSPPTTREGP